jgi:hypothetical protein
MGKLTQTTAEIQDILNGIQRQLSGSLTDGIPTVSEINSITGLTPITAGAGYQRTIKDTTGTGRLYRIESDGTDWYYTLMTKAV